MKDVIKFAVLFVGAFCITTITNIILWKLLIDGVVYDSTRILSSGIDYLSPGDWVSNDVDYVTTINPERSFKDNDQILESWSNFKLLLLWIVMLILSIAASGILGCWLGSARKPRKEST